MTELARVKAQREADLAGRGTVALRGALRAEYANACREWAWQCVFPHRDVSTALIHTHVLNQGRRAVRSPLDVLKGVRNRIEPDIPRQSVAFLPLSRSVYPGSLRDDLVAQVVRPMGLVRAIDPAGLRR